MRFLVDECLGARLADRLTDAGRDAVHAVAIGLAGRPDPEVMSAARAQQRVLVSVDTDFGGLLARSGDDAPSVILLRRTDRTADGVARVVLDNLPAIEEDLPRGAFVVIMEQRLRIRPLPVLPQ